jgi:TonB family protein
VDQKSPSRPPSTGRQRVQNFLIYGFGLSIALHLLIGPLVKFDRTQPEEEKITKTTIDHVATPPPTPPPTPKPTPTPPPTPPPAKTPPPKTNTPEPVKPRIKINTLKTTAVKGGETEAVNTHTSGSENGVPTGTSTAAAPVPVSAATAAPAPPPTDPPTKPPSCANPNVEATTTNAVAPDTPPIAQQQGITGTVNVLINLDANSKIVGTPTVQSSPSQLLNAAAIKAAEESTFRTEIKNCEPVAATYIFSVEFNNN